MHSLYLLQPAVGAPGLPNFWSFSALSQWQKCPRQWFLAHSKFPNSQGKYPTPYGFSAFQGRLVHSALERYLELVRKGSLERFNPRQYFRRQFKALIEEEDAANPRVNTTAFKAKFSLNSCMAVFRRITDQISVPSINKASSRVRNDQPFSYQPSNSGEELWVEVDHPPVCGRIDRASNSCLADFKTGDQKDEHKDQLEFYAMLWWIRFGELPKSLRIIYPDPSIEYKIPVPTLDEIIDLKQRYNLQIMSIQDILSSGEIPANPNENNCRVCPVRQYCDDFWVSKNTATLRIPLDDYAGKVHYLDIQSNQIANDQIQNGGVSGTFKAENLGEVSFFIEREKCPISVTQKVFGVRLLGAIVKRDRDKWRVRLGAFSEAFWKVKRS